jgi:hypothetical protein
VIDKVLLALQRRVSDAGISIGLDRAGTTFQKGLRSSSGGNGLRLMPGVSFPI